MNADDRSLIHSEGITPLTRRIDPISKSQRLTTTALPMKLSEVHSERRDERSSGVPLVVNRRYPCPTSLTMAKS